MTSIMVRRKGMFRKNLSSGQISITFLVGLLAVLMLTIPGEVRAASGDIVPGQFIVVVNEQFDPAQVAADHAAVPLHVYTVAAHGFAARLTPGRLRTLATDPRVDLIEPDRVITLVPPFGPPRLHIRLHENDFETLTTGIDRTDAEKNPRTDVSGIGLAIIDTGIWKTHVDLNVAGGYNCTGKDKSKWNDDNGHGTHVAGIAAAKTGDNKGVRGVAPNARLYAVKVLDRSGSGFLSWVICGVDWVTGNAAANGIQVANMSLGFMGTSSTLNVAIGKSVAAGVTYAVAAGNESMDAKDFSPANHPDVITVSAMGDSDGKCGGIGPATSDGADDTFASFSNFGSLVELAAPGVDITSTWKGDRKNPGGFYATASGTSMASPHVAGAAAQYKASNPGASPADIRTALIALGTAQSPLACSLAEKGGFSGDTDGFAEPLVDAESL